MQDIWSRDRNLRDNLKKNSPMSIEMDTQKHSLQTWLGTLKICKLSKCWLVSRAVSAEVSILFMKQMQLFRPQGRRVLTDVRAAVSQMGGGNHGTMQIILLIRHLRFEWRQKGESGGTHTEA